jgi:cobyrinic acid a,c-diamide synthase
MATSSSRLIFAGLSGDSGKTIASLSFLAAVRQRGHSVSVFKKGPDYIDPAWLSLVGQTACRSLDTYLVDREVVFNNFVVHAADSDISVIEGNRGLFDGKDVSGTHSTAELAKLLEAPVVLIVNVRKSTRTVAAVVKGCVDFDPDVTVAGVLLNRVAGERHLRVIREAIERYTGLPVLGAIPNLSDELIPGRHLGLVTPAEFGDRAELERRLRGIADSHLDVDRMIGIAQSAPSISCQEPEVPSGKPARVKIGYFDDSVFTFYYPENLEALERHGAELVPLSSLDDAGLPAVDALYIGGGFPETHAEKLAGNRSMMESVKEAATNGLPIYAECGGLIYLARSVEYGGRVHAMTGLFSVDLAIERRPVGHGYASVVVDAPNPFYAKGTEIRGHEFHYSGPTGEPDDVESCMKVESGVGVGGGRDGLVTANTLACYVHIHADGVEEWASSLVSKAADYKAKRGKPSIGGGDSWIESKVI